MSILEVQHQLTTYENVIIMDGRLVIPSFLEIQTLHILHTAHQGVTNMMAHANVSVYWPARIYPSNFYV